MKFIGQLLFPLVVLASHIVIILEADSTKDYLSIFLTILLAWFIGFVIDKYRASNKQLVISQNHTHQFKQGLQSTLDGIAISDHRGDFEFINDSYYKMYQYREGELTKWTQCYDASMIEWIEANALPLFLENGYWKGELQGRRKDGSLFPQEMSISRIQESNKIICVVRDATEKRSNEQLIERMALHNDMTDLPNRRSLLNTINDKIMRAQRFSLIFIDLDRFKTVNDTFGHHTGDEVIKEIGRRFTPFENEATTAFHLDGDEFVLLKELTAKDRVSDFVEQVLHHIQQPIAIGRNEVTITASLGITHYPEHAADMEHLLKYADFTMYHIKQQGKNSYQFYNDEVKAIFERKVLLEKELKKALQNEELYLTYQPKFDLTTHEMVGYEALIRWNNPHLGQVSPAEFIPLAEETSLIVEIGEWVIENVLQQLSHWKQKGHPLLKVSINISNIQIKHEQFLDTLTFYMQEHNIAPPYIELEITESLTSDDKKTIPLLEAIKSHGVGLSIDDFGTGYSSLHALNHLPIDTLKIDRSFVKDMETTKYGTDILKSMIDIGKNLKLDIIVEGIEKEEHVLLLKKLGCRTAQGYYFSKPLLPSEIEEYFLKKMPVAVNRPSH
ncbi:EAL domain-containing protein [Halobacillus salinarum]|uniref:EAL domain-containing protein n=1 Tax=Halobacillus salinarum TaxID=2932257 RepID=A0ABY4EMC9_9BACI|nr:EAL domain-containing protein [Halobacillus salinarum]UOQ45606.1 EAL domain-containing protein [Halobacillus salinarum]